MEEVKGEAKRRKIKLLILPTVEAIEELKQHPTDTNAIRTMSGAPMEPVPPDPLVCDACGQPVESLSRCVWDESLMVGSCCEVYTDHQCPACRSDNLEFGDTAVKCLDCGCVTTEAESEIKIGPFELTSPTDMPQLDPIRICPVKATAPEFRRSGAA